jgi:hypothetical protein
VTDDFTEYKREILFRLDSLETSMHSFSQSNDDKLDKMAGQLNKLGTSLVELKTQRNVVRWVAAIILPIMLTLGVEWITHASAAHR